MRRGRNRGGRQRQDHRPPPARKPRLRIIGGRFRGHILEYLGDPRTRPMKDRVREAVFNLLGPAVRDKLAIDLFAGTGALGLEAISRGASGAMFLEQHFPTARCIERNIAALGLQASCRVLAGNTFVQVAQWKDRPPVGDRPWIVLCSPPYDFYVSRQQEMLRLAAQLRQLAPPASLFVLESDPRFDFRLVQPLGSWDIREYPPAVVAILEVPDWDVAETSRQVDER